MKVAVYRGTTVYIWSYKSLEFSYDTIVMITRVIHIMVV